MVSRKRCFWRFLTRNSKEWRKNMKIEISRRRFLQGSVALSIAGGAACRKGGPFVGFRPVCSCRYVFDHSRGGDLPAFGYDRNV